MIKCISYSEINEVLNYIGNDFFKCIYLYQDLKKYGVSNVNIKCWIQLDKNKNIKSVLLKYYSAYHIYSKENDAYIDEIIEMIKKDKPSIICSEKAIIKKIQNRVKNIGYISEFGWVRELTNIDYYKDALVVEAEKKDFKEIARLLYEDDDIGASYKLGDLEKQLYERNQSNYSRNYIIKKDNKVIAHAATGAEDEKFAMLAYVITVPGERGKGYAKKVCSAICKDLIDEGKKVYLINYTNESTALYDKLGFKVCCDWGKLYLDLKEN